jgi:hypothetical protein
MKQWFALTCPVCGFRYPLKKFNPAMKPIAYPVQVVTGGGRARGFTVAKYLPWPILPTLKQTDAWNSLLCLYNRLGAAYDHFYQVVGWLSPEVKRLLQESQSSYVEAYRTNPFQDYAKVYATKISSENIAEPYSEPDYPDAYAHFLMNQIPGGLADE